MLKQPKRHASREVGIVLKATRLGDLGPLWRNEIVCEVLTQRYPERHMILSQTPDRTRKEISHPAHTGHRCYEYDHLGEKL